MSTVHVCDKYRSGGKMKLISKALLFLVVTIFLAAGCVSFPKGEEKSLQSSLTFAVVKSKIIKGQTTQDEILKTFGSPNIITKNRSNDEVWNYNRMSYRAVSGTNQGPAGIFSSGERAMSTATTESFDLIITFDDNGVVKDYSVISAKF